MLELKKLKYATEEEKQGKLYQWARLIAARSQKEVAVVAKGDEYLEAVAKEMSLINASEKERYLYLREQMAIMDEKSRQKTADRIGHERGYSEGWARGLQEGEIRKLISMVCRKLAKGKNISQIADELDESEDIITDICKAAETEEPEYDVDKIYTCLKSK